VIPNETDRYWMPLLALFTGARSGELLQLYVVDIKEHEGIDYLYINDDGEDKRLKNPQSERFIPIHPKLKELGFMNFVELRHRQGEKRLFPTCKQSADSYYSSAWGKWFNAHFLVKCGVKRAKVSMHSFRHAFIDATRNVDMPVEKSKQLTGHSMGDVHADYGAALNIGMLPALNEWMAKVEYKELDLSHLQARL